MRSSFGVLFLIMCFGLSEAQTITYSPAKTFSAGIIPQTPDNFFITIRNNGTTKINLTYTNVSYSFPAGWNVGVCDTYNCMGGINPGNWNLDSLKPGSGNEFYIELSVDPGTIIGNGYLKVHIWQNDFPNQVDTLVWKISSSGVGITEITDNKSIHVFPNPVKDILTLNNVLAENSSATLTDALGRNMITANINSTQNSIDVSSLAKGIYTLVIESKGKQFYKQIVKE
jgi:hypothetical protein